MPYKDPAKQRAANRETKRRQRSGGALDAIAASEGLPEPPDRGELLRILGVQARSGHVVAIRTLLEEYRRDGADDGQVQAAKSVIDELAERRRKAAG